MKPQESKTEIFLCSGSGAFKEMVLVVRLFIFSLLNWHQERQPSNCLQPS